MEAAIRNLPPSAVGDPSNLDAMGLLASHKGKPMEAIVEQVRDGSSLRVYLLPEFQFVQVFVAGIQVPHAFFLNTTKEWNHAFLTECGSFSQYLCVLSHSFEEWNDIFNSNLSNCLLGTINGKKDNTRTYNTN